MKQNSADKIIPVGLVGFGFSGRVFHAPVIHATPGMRLAAVVQRKEEPGGLNYSTAKLVRSLDELLSMEEIRLVVIATPNATHYELARKCLLAGRDVVVDKPFTVTLQEAIELVKLARQTGRLITAYHNSRCHGDFTTVRRLLKSGVLGRIVRCEMHFDRYRPSLRPGAWRESTEPGSGVFFDLGPHVIDQAMVLFGRPEAVNADIRIERDGAVVDDAFDVTFQYPGLRVDLCAGMLAVSPRPRFLLHGTDGAYIKYGNDPQEQMLRRGDLPGGPDWGRESKENWGVCSVSKADGMVATEVIPTEPGDYRCYYENVRDVLLGNGAPDVTPEQVLDVMRAIDLAQTSSRDKRTITW